MFSQRLFLCIQEVRRLWFLPYPFILEEFRLAHNQCSSKQTLRGQHNSTIGLNDTLVLSPQFIERNYTVPLILCCAIRQITQHHVNTVIGQMAHHFDAVTLNDTINKLVFSPILLWHLFAISSASTISPWNRWVPIGHKKSGNITCPTLRSWENPRNRQVSPLISSALATCLLLLVSICYKNFSGSNVDRTVANAILFIRKELPLSAASHRLHLQRYEIILLSIYNKV